MTEVTVQPPPLAIRWTLGLAIGVALVHMIVNAVTPYGFHRDEFLYMAMGRHLQLWRMDFPPFIAMLAQVTRGVLGDSLVAIRSAPALAGGALVVLSALIARALGGGRFAQLLAALAVTTSPLFLRTADLFQPVVFDQLWWTLALYALAQLGRDSMIGRAPSDSRRWWIVLGVACGVGLLTKFSALFLGAALGVALVVSPERRVLRTRWPWIALLIALVLGSPSVVGQLRLGFPVAAQMHTLQQTQLARVSAWSFITGQFLWGPSTILAMGGAIYLLRARAMRPFRAVGWTCVVAFVMLLVLHGKSYYIGGVYPTLYSAGAVGFLAWIDRWERVPQLIARASSTIVLLLFVGVALPFCLPILPPERMAEYGDRTGMSPATRTNMGRQLKLPQDYADMLGWPAQVAAVARIVDSLPPAKRAQVVIFASNYGEAGAIDFYGPKFGLPPAVSIAGTYWFFGPGDKPGFVLVTIGVPRGNLAPYYYLVSPGGEVRNEWGVPEETRVPIYIGEGPQVSLQQLWPSVAGRN